MENLYINKSTVRIYQTAYFAKGAFAMTKEKEYDYLVFIGRFQPFHLGHKYVIDTALKMANHVIVLAGSSNSSRNSRNPFTFEERKEMIIKSFENNFPFKHGGDNFSILPLDDYTYNDGEWIRAVQRIVNNHLRHLLPSKSYEDIAKINALKVGLIGHSKDHSSYYLKMFPTWGNIDVHGVKEGEQKPKLINATDIRNLYFSPQWRDMSWHELVTPEVKKYLTNWILTEHYQEIVNEHKFIVKYKKQFEALPYPPTFLTVDSVVVQGGHVLLIRRKAFPGKGKLAIPGGFLEQDETLLTGALRELREETKLKVPEAVLRGSIAKQKVFDDPNRSARGRTVTTAFLFNLPPQTTLPKVKGGDDAKEAFWVPLSELKAHDMFEDHYHLIRNLTSDI